MTDHSAFEPSPFGQPGQWTRAGFHCHSINSDGGLTPAETVATYRALGYECLGITDHAMVTNIEGFSDATFVALDSTENGGDPDVIGIGVREAVPREWSLDDRCAALAQQGGFAIAAHPHYCAVDPNDYVHCPDLHALEICNAYCDQAYANGIATEVWDLVLGQGKRVWGVAGDDAHLNPKKRYFSRAGQAWVEVWARELTRPAILDALKRGAFYSTQGPKFHAFHIDGTRPRIECSPVAQVRWRTYGRVGFVDHAAQSGAITNSQLPDWFEPSVFLRIELVDRQGRRAWSNPFFVAAPDVARSQ